MSADLAATIDRVLQAHRSACLDDPGDAERVRQALVEAIGADQGQRAPAREVLTVDEALKAEHVVEWRHVWEGRPQYWWQAEMGTGRVRLFASGLWRDWFHSVLGADHRARPCRLVPLAEADAPPESRGPIGGDS